jgi:predicted enzyme related to lactoylglutathione lyase
MIECVIPILRVSSLHVSLDYYVRVLGFQKDWPEDSSSAVMAGISRDGFSIYLCQGEQGCPGTWIWIGVEDVETFYSECRARGATIRQEPTDYPWAYEMRIEDPDGHVLRIRSEPRSGA